MVMVGAVIVGGQLLASFMVIITVLKVELVPAFNVVSTVMSRVIVWAYVTSISTIVLGLVLLNCDGYVSFVDVVVNVKPLMV